MQNTKKVLSLIATFVMAMMIFVGCSSKPTTMQDREGNEFNVPKEVNTIISTAPVLSLIATFVMAMMIFVGCSSKPTTMQDREGNEFNVPKEVNTIISTAPSNTEVLVALGLADKLVAVDKYSADVEGISEDLPKIDFRNPDAEAIIALNPDIVIASGHNKAGDEDPFALIKEAGIPVAYIPSSYSIDGIYGDIEFIASLTDTEKEGKDLINSMKEEIESIKSIGNTITDKKNVYFEIGAGSGLYTFGNETFLNEMIETIGATNVFGEENSWITVALIKEAGIPVAYIPSSYSIDGIYGDIEFIASLTDTEKEGKDLINSMKEEIESIKSIGNTITDKKNVYFEIGAGSGLYTFGNETFLNEMIETIGATNVFGEENSWITVTPEAVIDANPDVILANTPGTNEAGLTAVEDIKSREGWDTVAAVQNGDVYEIDKNSSSRASQNIIKALKEMAKAVYPDEYKDF